ncbi:methylated-DNA--[protein]-cysteine S-methyltransferase [Xanthocytophaga agilis]|uniref:Methylated-DNA--protein-cysteine methyltransferase n=1 Tax=Xanthocytophaga agilis TaxID=3048010 RepID=A0AAE3R2X6_9BACT|nr:methylated-DNA--[protein]-cysteine S-methyltransferase [Xanthocytophaga agilis]MDJ1502686.1 methylated-DNA--[protein]-cysteine S-methyltransferase [Xanthocytophaga agilis]
MYYHKKINSPVGELTLVATDKSLMAVLWENDDPTRIQLEESIEQEDHVLLVEAGNQLAEYFGRKRTGFELPLEFTGTEFQKKVWQALLTIPFGETRTYGQIAQQIGDPNAVRAVGGAANKNPISIIAPCHRVIGASGKLTGFAGGLKTKSYLLQLEYTKRNPTLWQSWE